MHQTKPARVTHRVRQGPRGTAGIIFFGNVAPSNNKSFLTTRFYSEQVRSLQVLETVNLMAKGFPHRMRHRAFNSRYRMLVKQSLLNSSGSGTGSSNPDPDKAVQDCQIILDAYSKESSAKEQGEMISKQARLFLDAFPASRDPKSADLGFHLQLVFI